MFRIGPEAGGVEFKHDALGRRIEKRVVEAAGADIVTRYVYDGARVVEEYGGTGQLQADYVFGNYIGEVLRMRRDTTGDGTRNTTFWYQLNDMFKVVSTSLTIHRLPSGASRFYHLARPCYSVGKDKRHPHQEGLS